MLCLNLIIPNITPRAYFWGSLYMEGVFHFKHWFLDAPGLIHGGAYYRNITVSHNSVIIATRFNNDPPPHLPYFHGKSPNLPENLYFAMHH